MTDESQQRQSLFPDVPREIPEVDKDGNFKSLWSLGFGALFQALQENFKSEGILIPKLSNDNITTIQSLYTPYINHSYDSLTRVLPDISGQTTFNTDTKITNQFVIAQDNTGTVIVAQWVPLSVMLMSPINPNYAPGPSPPARPGVAGILNWLCYDIADKQLWICTTSGSQITAVWTLIV